MLPSFILYAFWLPYSLALYSEYFPPPVEGVTIVSSEQKKDIKLSYKQAEICAPSYSGYIHLPASTLKDIEGGTDYDMNMFFWYFPARHSPSTAPISIWIGGGPGQSAIEGAVTQNGPCYVNQDGNSTTENPFLRNNHVNMLYIDQPIGAGFSYSSLVNVTYNQLTTAVTPTDFSDGIPITPNLTVFPGTDSQNKKIEAEQLNARLLQLDTLGIENGCIDALSQTLSFVSYPYNNTYGLQMINETTFNALVESVTDPEEGCISRIRTCRELAKIGDPNFNANNHTVNDHCALATEQCFPILEISSTYANRNVFDIAQIGPQSFPGYQHIGFLNQRWVQQSLGVPINFTESANLTALYFAGTADPFRQDQSNIEYLLQNNIQVALVYGDRDTRCNWVGVENVSLTVDYPDAQNFRSAGYANIQTNESYVGGVVRQYDGFSFARVFDAGHIVSSSQPQTSYEIFNSVMFRQDVATGRRPAEYNHLAKDEFKSRSFRRSLSTKKTALSHYQSKGPSSSWSIKNVLPPSPEPVCNIWAAAVTCTNNQLSAIANQTAETHDFWVTLPKPLHNF
ncbi:alpha/beta-hydrolase [Tothia fuscella]|uniref:Alpha/beta-hydrolase n=1 Tax=Tothia fuscella TaxID=1048955 RepID=A0A9P4U1E7_9PEZI|nr:alpha/beta-hydrolase [Tothia fuscella]